MKMKDIGLTGHTSLAPILGSANALCFILIKILGKFDLIYICKPVVYRTYIKGNVLMLMFHLGWFHLPPFSWNTLFASDIITAHKVWAKVMFLHVSVILFTGGCTWAGTPPGRYTPLGRYTPSGQVHPQPPGRYTPRQVHPCGQVPPRRYTCPPTNTCWDTVNKRAVRILLECILVFQLN